ncbi:uncharacterized protein [Miscanthus floridulus]|uniref:uncharacterized protein isoform X4 n=1 Tax=Miscanthus floridulus TaxID=154761 RepID=UPI003457FC70
MAPAGGGDEVGESGGPSKRRRVERSAAGGAKEGQSLGVESGSGKSKDPVMSKEYLEVRCEDSQRIIREIEDLKSEVDEDLRQLGYCKENEKLRADLAVKVKERHCLMKRIEELEAKIDFLRKRTEELEAINDGLPKRNEELQAKNDDLTKQNKELQARNDSLTKGNEELQAKNDDLHKNQVVSADSIQANDAELATQKEEIKSLKAYLGEESYSKKKDFCQQKIEDGEKLEKPLRATKAILKIISSEKETTEESLKTADEGESSSDELQSSNNDESRSSGTSDDNTTDEDGSDSGESTRTESLTFNTQFSMHKLMKLICALTEPQKRLIDQCGFGSILKLKCRNMPYKQLIVWLARYYDEKTQCIKIPGTGAFKIDALTVHWILGIPRGRAKIKARASREVKSVIANDTTPGPLAPKIQDLIAMITPELMGDRFVRIFMLVVLSIFLCPTSSTRASCHYYEGIHLVKKIKSYDWCDAVMSSLKSGLSKFQKYVGKGNTCEKATLSGCIFVLFTAYFDYLGSEINIVPQTIPRIDAWTDDFVDQYMVLYPKFKKMEIKKVECTVFGKTHFNQRSTRDSCFDASNESPSAANVAGPSSQHKTSKKVKKQSTKGPSHTLLHENVQIDRYSAQRVIPDCTDSGFRVFSGEELHLDVDKYIRSITGTDCSNEVFVNLRNLCQSFFKDSFRKYISSVEPVIVSQSCALVKSYLSGLQQSHTEKVSGDPSKENVDDDTSSANTDGFLKLSIHTDKIVGGSSNWKDHDGSSNLDIAASEKSPIDTQMGDASPSKDKEDDAPSNPVAHGNKKLSIKQMR